MDQRLNSLAGDKMNQRQQVNIDLSEGSEEPCPKCGKNIYNVVFKIIKISKLAKSNPTGKDIMIPQSYFKCENKKCGHLMKGIRPT